MKLKTENVGSERYNDSVVYRFKVLVDGEPITITTNDEVSDRIFAVQVQDGRDAAQAIRNTLEAIKKGLEGGPAQTTPDVEV